MPLLGPYGSKLQAYHFKLGSVLGGKVTKPHGTSLVSRCPRIESSLSQKRITGVTEFRPFECVGGGVLGFAESVGWIESTPRSRDTRDVGSQRVHEPRRDLTEQQSIQLRLGSISRHCLFAGRRAEDVPAPRRPEPGPATCTVSSPGLTNSPLSVVPVASAGVRAIGPTVARELRAAD